MKERYTNPADRGRFGFSESGKYRAPFKGDYFIVALLIAALILGEIFIIGFGAKIIKENVNDQNEALLFGIMAVTVIVILSVLVILGLGAVIRYIINGYACTYAANDEKFTAIVGGDTHIIYYSDVQDITFKPRTFFGKVKGYTVTITVAGEKQEYGISFDGYQSEKTTPFYIIQERIDAMKHEEDLRRVQKISKSTELGSGIPVEKSEAALNQSKSLAQRVDDLMVQSDEEFMKKAMQNFSNQQIPVQNLADKQDSMPTIGSGKK